MRAGRHCAAHSPGQKAQLEHTQAQLLHAAWGRRTPLPHVVVERDAAEAAKVDARAAGVPAGLHQAGALLPLARLVEEAWRGGKQALVGCPALLLGRLTDLIIKPYHMPCGRASTAPPAARRMGGWGAAREGSGGAASGDASWERAPVYHQGWLGSGRASAWCSSRAGGSQAPQRAL